MSDSHAIVTVLSDFAATIPPEVYFPTDQNEASLLAVTDPYAFCLAACLDRGTKSENIWAIPFDLKTKLGHLDPRKIIAIPAEELSAIIKSLPHKPRYTNAAPRTILELTRIVIEECGGDASRIWTGKSAAEVKRTFDSIYGVGLGLSNMALLLIEKAFPVRFADRHNMDIKPDVHTVRVLYRLGVSAAQDERSALEASRQMTPEFPGKLDGPLWVIGRTWCHASGPECSACIATTVCAKRT